MTFSWICVCCRAAIIVQEEVSHTFAAFGWLEILYYISTSTEPTISLIYSGGKLIGSFNPYSWRLFVNPKKMLLAIVFWLVCAPGYSQLYKHVRDIPIEGASGINHDSAGNLYVLQPYYKKVHVYDRNGNPIRSFPVLQGDTSNIAISGNRLVVSYWRYPGSIHEYDLDGQYVRKIGGADRFPEPRSLTFSAAGLLYVGDQNGTITVVDANSNTLGSWYRPSTSAYLGLSEVPNVGVISTHAYPPSVEIFNPNQGTVDIFANSTVPTNLIPSLAHAWGIQWTMDGKVLVNDCLTNRIIIFDQFGKYLQAIPLPNITNASAIIESMTEVNGRIFMSASYANQIMVYEEATAPITIATVNKSPRQTGWYTDDLQLNLSSTDNYGVRSMRYQVDNGVPVETSNSSAAIDVIGDGKHQLQYSATDINDNNETNQVLSLWIDRVPPVSSASIDTTGMVVTVIADDAVSGVSRTYYSVDGGPVTDYKDRIIVPLGVHNILFWSSDVAGNVESVKMFQTPDFQSNKLQIQDLRLSSSSTLGGRTISSTISLSTAQSTPTTINLGSDNTNVVVPASITIDAGQTSKTFTIETKPVAAYTQTNITATLGTQTRTAQLDLLPPTARIRISPPLVSAESTAKATITLSGNAPTGGLVVELESDESAASVPSYITVAEGQKTATFNIVVGKVTEETYAYITATIDGVSSEASLTIRPKSIKPTTLSITESLVGGTSGTGTITLSDPAPEGGLDVDLATDNAAVSLPLVVKVAEGSKTANFSFSTTAVSSTITATVSAKANGATVTDTIEVRVRPLGTLVASPSTLPGKATGTLTLTLSSPTTTPLTVNVTSSNAAVVLASKTITIAKGQSSGILKFTTALLGTDTTSTITCLLNGLEAKADITVRSAKPSNLSLLPAVVLGGKGSIGTVTIDSAAPASGLTVALSSSDSSAVVPSFVLVPSGKTTATFTITTSKVTSSKNVTITAQANGVSKTATLGVRILTIASISFNPVSVEGGVKANGLLTLTDVAPLGGMTVTLTSDKSGVTVPSTVVVPAGKSSVAFVASTSVTGSSYDATITGIANGETGSGMLKVLAPAVSSFTLSSTSVKGGDKPLGTVKIAKASSVDVVVNLSSSNAAIASLPASIIIPKGQLLATFQVTTSKPTTATSVTLSATTGGLAKVVVLKVSP